MPDHLVFLIPGFGSENETGAIKYSIELLSQWGYSVAVFDSPASQRFIEKTSSNGILGLQVLDAQDLYEGMKLARLELEKSITKRFKYSRVSLVGLSLGALNAQMVQLIGAMDKSGDALKFNHVVAVNPPIQNAYGLGLIDRMIMNFKKNEIGNLIDSALNLISEFPLRQFGFFQLGQMAQDLQRSSLTAKNAEDLIAFGFANTVQNALKAYQNRHPEDRRSFTGIQTFHQLFNQITMWQLSKNETLKKDLRLQAIYKTLQSNQANGMDDLLIAQDSIFNNAQVLEKIESFKIITFDDDFLVSDKDVAWLKNDFKNKATVFSNGGHLGGFYLQNFQDQLRTDLDLQ